MTTLCRLPLRDGFSELDLQIEKFHMLSKAYARDCRSQHLDEKSVSTIQLHQVDNNFNGYKDDNYPLKTGRTAGM